MAGRPPNNTSIVSEAEILKAALQLIDEGGEKAVTFRTLARKFDVTPMAIAHHVGSRQEMLSKLVTRAFQGIGSDAEGKKPMDRLRFLLTRYCERALDHPNLIRCVLADMSLFKGELCMLTQQLRFQISLLGEADPDDALLNLLVDYTHGFVFSASVAEPPHQTDLETYLKSLDLALERITRT